MAFMDKTRCKAVVTVTRALAPWTNPRHDMWGKQPVVILDFLPGRFAVFMPIMGDWLMGEAQLFTGEVVPHGLPKSIGVTTSEGGQVVAATVLSELMDKYHDLANDESQLPEIRSVAAAGFCRMYEMCTEASERLDRRG